MNQGLAAEADAEEHQRRFDKHWGIGGFAYLTSFGDLLYNADSNRGGG